MSRLSATLCALALVAASTATTLAVITWPQPAAAQQPARPPVTIDRRAAVQVLDNLDVALNSYVFPEKVPAIQARLKARRADYLKITDRDAFAAAIAADMKAAGQDLHLNLRADDLVAAGGAQIASDAEAQALDQAAGFGFADARRLPGNIGYLNLRFFCRENAWPMIDAALTLLQHTDALIIDLRGNNGGSVAHARLLGHLSVQPIPMQRLYWRKADGGFDVETHPVSQPPGGALYDGKPVYVLIAPRTFSAAEAFTYAVKAARRATVVGEKTRGGGNPSNRPVTPGAGLLANIPNGRVEHVVDGGTWEGVGITPDVTVAKEDAVLEAYKRALAAAKPSRFPYLEADRAAALADPAKAVAGL